MNSAAAMRFDWLERPDLAALLNRLGEGGEEARVVGGAVRNSLLNEAVADWDIAATLMPEAVMHRCRQAGWKVAPTGLRHGTVTVIVRGAPFEVTTLREDIDTDGRHAEVKFSRDFQADALRRDFTINALSVTADGQLFDYANGLDDLKARRVRFIGDADQRIREDYLRILRLFRFHARYAAGPLDSAGLRAAIRGRAGLARLSRERIQAEFLKLLTAQRGPEVTAEIGAAGFLAPVLRGGFNPQTLQAMALREAENNAAPDAIRRLAALAIWSREDAARLAEGLRLSNDQARSLAAMALMAETRPAPPDRAGARALIYRHGRRDSVDMALFAAAQPGAGDWRAALDLIRDEPQPVLPWRGADAAARGAAPGPAVGAVLAEAERRWIAAGLPDKAETADYLDQAISGAPARRR